MPQARHLGKDSREVVVVRAIRARAVATEDNHHVAFPTEFFPKAPDGGQLKTLDTTGKAADKFAPAFTG